MDKIKTKMEQIQNHSHECYNNSLHPQLSVEIHCRLRLDKIEPALLECVTESTIYFMFKKGSEYGIVIGVMLKLFNNRDIWLYEQNTKLFFTIKQLRTNVIFLIKTFYFLIFWVLFSTIWGRCFSMWQLLLNCKCVYLFFEANTVSGKRTTFLKWEINHW